MNKTTTIIFNEEVCTLTSEMSRETFDRRQKHTLLYISCPFSPEDLKSSGFTEQPPYSRKGDTPEIDKAWRRYNKAELQIERDIITKAVQGGLLDAGLAKELKWSRKAGCSCGCSPGWKARDYGQRTGWLTVISPSKEEEQRKADMDRKSAWEAEKLTSMVI